MSSLCSETYDEKFKLVPFIKIPKKSQTIFIGNVGDRDKLALRGGVRVGALDRLGFQIFETWVFQVS